MESAILSTSKTETSQTNKVLLAESVLFLIALSVRLVFWWATRWAIEDGMIIARMVKNLVEYGQFSFNLGERISSSTSPIFGLLCAALASTGIPPLASAQIIGIIASSLTVVLIFRILYRSNKFETKPEAQRPLSIISAAAGSCIYAFLPPVISYSISGLETPVYALLCALTLDRLAHLDDPVAQRTAVWLAAFTTVFRPDGAIILAVVCAVQLWRGRTDLWKTIANFWPILIVIPTAIILHQLYFGVPIPHSFLAKADGYHIDILRNAKRYLNQMLFAQRGSMLIYLLALLGVFRSFRQSRSLLVFIFWYLIYHVLFILRAPLFDWYLQVPLFTLCLFAALGIFAASDFVIRPLSKFPRIAWLRPIASIGLSAILLIALVPYIKSRQANQSYTMTVLAGAGQWLTENTSPDTLAFTETLGYIGYYAHNRFVDWPGLASPGVPALLKEKGFQTNRIQAFDAIIAAYNPDYLVLREHEWGTLAATLQSQYQICTQFNSPAETGGTSYWIASHHCP